MDDKTLEEKLVALKVLLGEIGSALIAFSGGVDSTLLLKIAAEVLGDQVLAVTAASPSMPDDERSEAEELVGVIGVKHEWISTHEMEDTRYLANTPNRCFFCKDDLYGELINMARQKGYRYVLDGANLDDRGDHRPGRKAAQERGVRSPLSEAGLTKAEIRELSRRAGLPNWNKPAAACLSSRIPYGTTITLERLSQVEQAETALRRLGFRQVRVRHHDQVARIEIEPGEFNALLDQRETIIAALKKAGYAYITLDLAGFRSGSMNETLPESQLARADR